MLCHYAVFQRLYGSIDARRAEALRACVDSIDAPARQAILICGDFNATPAEINMDIPGVEMAFLAEERENGQVKEFKLY